MKYRAGFVSNSSSSSFIIGIKNKKLSVEALMEVFEVSESSPLYSIACDLAEVMYNNATLLSKEDCPGEFGFPTLEAAVENDIKQAILITNGFKVYNGYASDESGPIEAMLCKTEIDFESDDLIIFCEGGY